MKKLLIASALSAAFVSPAVFAQAQNFTGFYGQVGIGYENNNVGSDGPNNWIGPEGQVSPTNISFGSVNSNNFSGNLGLGYGLAITDKVLVSLGVEFQPFGNNTGNVTYTRERNGAVTTPPGNYYNISNRYSIFLAPGYVFDENKMAYLKAGYSGQTVKAKGTSSTLFGYSENSTSSTVGGFLVGLGYRQLLSKNVYLFTEANYYQYDAASFKFVSTLGDGYTNTLKPKTTAFNFLLGIGARF